VTKPAAFLEIAKARHGLIVTDASRIGYGLILRERMRSFLSDSTSYFIFRSFQSTYLSSLPSAAIPSATLLSGESFMPTAKQSAASRANAQKSTGPRTPQGKAASRFNALKHGIHAETQVMFDENPADLAELTAELHDHYRPADPDQRFLVDTLVSNEWRLRRLRAVEASLWSHAADAFLNINVELPSATSGEAFATVAGPFARLQQIMNSCERNYYRARKELQRFAAAPDTQPDAEVVQVPPPAEPDSHPQPEQSTTTSASSASFRNNPQPAPESPANPFVLAETAAPDRARTLREAA